MRKEYAANKKGITLVEVWENDWSGKCDEVKSHISDFVSYPTFSPSPYYILKEFLDSLDILLFPYKCAGILIYGPF